FSERRLSLGWTLSTDLPPPSHRFSGAIVRLASVRCNQARQSVSLAPQLLSQKLQTLIAFFSKTPIGQSSGQIRRLF
ncbi:MAG TPA: hypothetical protein VF208_13510, partial [Candidatus Binatia bacterium]